MTTATKKNFIPSKRLFQSQKNLQWDKSKKKIRKHVKKNEKKKQLCSEIAAENLLKKIVKEATYTSVLPNGLKTNIEGIVLADDLLKFSDKCFTERQKTLLDILATKSEFSADALTKLGLV